jgi:thiazole synthase
MDADVLTIGGRTFSSRLFVGTGKYKDVAETRAALDASGAEVVTVAVRRVDFSKASDQSLFEYLRERKFTLLPNTAGCYTAEDAVRTCRLAREAGMTDFVKLEVLGDPATLFPDVEQTLAAAKILVKEGFTVLPYINRTTSKSSCAKPRCPSSSTPVSAPPPMRPWPWSSAAMAC